MKKTSYQEFLLRKKQAEADYLLTERALNRDLNYINDRGVKQILTRQIKDQIAPQGSLLGRLINPSKQSRRQESRLLKKVSSARNHTYRSLTSSGDGAAAPLSKRERVLGNVWGIAKPVLLTLSVGAVRGYLRKKFRLLRFVL